MAALDREARFFGADMVARAAAKNPDAEAMVCGDKRMSWREVIRESQRIAGGFRGLGLSSGERVAILLGNRIELPLILFAAAHQGLTALPESHGRRWGASGVHSEEQRAEKKGGKRQHGRTSAAGGGRSGIDTTVIAEKDRRS